MSPADRDRARPARRPRRARPRGPLDPVRRPDRAARRDRRRSTAPTPPARMQEIYAEPIKPELITARLERDARRRASPSPARCRRSAPRSSRRPSSTPASTCSSSAARRCRPSTSRGQAEPLNLKEFIYELDVPVIVGGCATYQAALHLMRTGAAGVLVGFGGGAAHTTRTRARHRACRWPPRSPTSPPRAATTSTSPAAATCTSSPTARRPLRRHRQGGRLRRRRGDGRLAARPGHRGARPRLPLGLRGAPPRAAARRAGRDRHGRHARGDPVRPVAASPTAR